MFVFDVTRKPLKFVCRYVATDFECHLLIISRIKVTNWFSLVQDPGHVLTKHLEYQSLDRRRNVGLEAKSILIILLT